MLFLWIISSALQSRRIVRRFSDRKKRRKRKETHRHIVHEEDITVKREKINYPRDVNAEFENIFNYELLSTWALVNYGMWMENINT